jgi:hypothetical protein
LRQLGQIIDQADHAASIWRTPLSLWSLLHLIVVMQKMGGASVAPCCDAMMLRSLPFFLRRAVQDVAFCVTHKEFLRLPCVLSCRRAWVGCDVLALKRRCVCPSECHGRGRPALLLQQRAPVPAGSAGAVRRGSWMDRALREHTGTRAGLAHCAPVTACSRAAESRPRCWWCSVSC